MNNLFFKPEDFAVPGWTGTSFEQAAKIANRLLQERSVRVYFNDEGLMNEQGRIEVTSRKPRPLDTHQALLICIEELPKKPCEYELRGVHATDLIDINDGIWCKHCGVKLKAKWEVAE